MAQINLFFLTKICCGPLYASVPPKNNSMGPAESWVKRYMLKPLFDKKNQVSRRHIDQVMAKSFHPMSRQNVVILTLFRATYFDLRCRGPPRALSARRKLFGYNSAISQRIELKFCMMTL